MSARERRSLLAVALAELALGLGLILLAACPCSDSDESGSSFETSAGDESGDETGCDDFEDPIRFDVLSIPDAPSTPLPEPPQ